MKATIVDSHHCIAIDHFQIDLIYQFNNCTLTIFIEGTLHKSVTLNPSRQMLSYTNILDVASYYLTDYLRRDQQTKTIL
jgi:adenine specific DNA methylase Mod